MAQILVPFEHRGGSTANTTTFLTVGSGVTDSQTTETQIQVTWRVAGTFSNLYVNVATNTVTATSTIRYRLAAANGNQNVSIGASATGEFQDTTNTDTVASGSKIDIQVAAGATGTTLTFFPCAMLFAPAATSNTINKQMSGASSSFTASASAYFQSVAGQFNTSSTTTEANAQFKNKTAATLQNLFAHILSNGVTATSVIRTRIAGANGNLNVSVGSSATGVFEDTTDSDTLSSGSLINYQMAVGSTGTSINIGCIAVDHITTNNTAHYLAGFPSGIGYTSFCSITAGNSGAATESQFQTLAQLAFTASNLECFITSNASGSATVRFRKNATNGNQVLSIGTSATGYFEDTVNSDAVVATDEINYSVSSATPKFGTLGFLATYPTPVVFPWPGRRLVYRTI